MSIDELHRLRMVIQQIEAVHPSYRVVVYGDREKPRHADFKSGQMLLDALHAALPDFDASRLSLDALAEGHGSIVFTGEVAVDDRQLGLLGLADRSG